MADQKQPGNNDAGDGHANRPRAFPIPTPIPDDSSGAQIRPDDDDAVDFGQMPATASGSAILSHSQVSGPLSGTSVVAWTDLMKARAEEEAKLKYDSLDNIDLDAESDQDLLAHALASEPPSGKLNIPKDDRPHGALSQEFIDLDAEAGLLGQNKHIDDESVLPNFSAEDQSSSILSERHLRDVKGASHIDLLAAEGSPREGDAQTEEIDMARAIADAGESSAVDLGSEPIIDLPFPSSGSSLGSGPRSKSSRSSVIRRRSDNSTVDLLTGTSGQGLSSIPGITAVGSSLQPDTGLPATKRVDVFNGRNNNWLTSGLIGGLTGVAVCVGVWLSGALSGPKSSANSNLASNPAPIDPQVVAVRTALEKAKLDAKDPATAVNELLQAKSHAENAAQQALGDRQTLEASRRAIQQQLADATQRVAQVADEKRAVEAELAKARADGQTKEIERRRISEELKAAQARVTAAASAPKSAPTQPSPATDKTELTQLREKVATLQAKSAELERELTAANRITDSLKQTLRDVGQFTAAVRQRVQARPEATPGEILTTLDSVLAQKTTTESGMPLPADISDVRAERSFHRGLSAYRAGHNADAEREFAFAAGLQPRDARIWYFLGLVQFELGHSEKAEASFRQAVQLERQNQPTTDSIDALLERLPPDTRKLLNDIRLRA